MDKLKRSAVVVLLLLSCVGCDQITKDAARNYLVSEAPISWFHDTIRLEYAENAGAFLSFGAGFSEQQRVILFQALPALALAGLAMVLVVSNGVSTLAIIAWSLVLSGGVGNLLDRMFHDGRVIDFMNLGIGSFRTGIFNVADVCITVGVVLFFLESIRQRNQSVTS